MHASLIAGVCPTSLNEVKRDGTQEKPFDTPQDPRHRQAQREAEQQNAVVQDTAGRFTCAAETADDFAYPCTHAQEALDLDLLVHRLALEIWREHPDRAPALLEALEEF